ncbi:MAG: hypothetical protein ACI9R3_003765 [Verrucomicrobiales bacterium]|jgi:hypothetical protein
MQILGQALLLVAAHGTEAERTHLLAAASTLAEDEATFSSLDELAQWHSLEMANYGWEPLPLSIVR